MNILWKIRRGIQDARCVKPSGFFRAVFTAVDRWCTFWMQNDSKLDPIWVHSVPKMESSFGPVSYRLWHLVLVRFRYSFFPECTKSVVSLEPFSVQFLSILHSIRRQFGYTLHSLRVHSAVIFLINWRESEYKFSTIILIGYKNSGDRFNPTRTLVQKKEKYSTNFIKIASPTILNKSTMEQNTSWQNTRWTQTKAHNILLKTAHRKP